MNNDTNMERRSMLSRRNFAKSMAKTTLAVTGLALIAKQNALAGDTGGTYYSMSR